MTLSINILKKRVKIFLFLNEMKLRISNFSFSRPFLNLQLELPNSPVQGSAARVLRSTSQSKILRFLLSLTFGTAAVVIYDQQVAPVSVDIMQSSADVSTTTVANVRFPSLHPFSGTGNGRQCIETLGLQSIHSMQEI